MPGGGQGSRAARRQERQGRKRKLSRAEKRAGREGRKQGAAELADRVAELDVAAAQAAERFAELPLSGETLRGLREGGYVALTKVQQLALPVALKGRDLLCAAKTGSGKTLSFVVPAIEALWRARWSTADGLGVVIVTPTRELAQQIFKVVKVVGKHHQLSGGIVTGGSDFQEEQQGVAVVNVLVGTPGRLLQHVDETAGLEMRTAKVLVLDEADRLLDEGFKQELDAIVASLSPERQTMLFSATQTKDLNTLARLCLRDPEYLSVHAESRHVTPRKLCQNYAVVPLKDKLSVVYSFVKQHVRAKTIVFFATCAQVKFVYLALSKLLRKTGACTMCLTGKMKPHQRQEVHDAFVQKTAACLFCTDVAARGLDFPAVKWVLQADCPDDVDTYIHRVGRTARAGANGASLLLLSPEEERFLQRLAQKRVRLREVQVNPKHFANVTPLLVALVVQDTEQKANAQKAVVAYLRSVYFQKDSEVFDVKRIDAAALSAANGLARPPTLRFVSQGSHEQKNLSWDLRNLQLQRERQQRRLQQKADTADTAAPKLTRAERKRKASHTGLLQEHQQRLAADSESSDGDVLFRAVQQEAGGVAESAGAAAREERPAERDDGCDAAEALLSRRKLRALKRNPLALPETVRGQRTVFEDSDDGADAAPGAAAAAAGGKALTPFEAAMRFLREKGAEGRKAVLRDDEVDKGELAQGQQTFKAELREAVKRADVTDKVEHRERVQAKHKKRKARLRAEAGLGPPPEEGAVLLGGASSDGSGGEGGGSDADESEGGPSGSEADSSSGGSGAAAPPRKRQRPADHASKEQQVLALLRARS